MRAVDVTPADLDPGIRETVMRLTEAGFLTTDSGDGDPALGGTPRPWEKVIPHGHVIMVVPDRSALVAEADRLVQVLEVMGLTVAPMGPNEPPFGTVQVEASYHPADGVAVLMVQHVLDRMWR